MRIHRVSHLTRITLGLTALLVLVVVSVAQHTTEQVSRVAALRSLDRSMVIQWDRTTMTPSRIKGKLSPPMTGDGRSVARDFFRLNAGLFRMVDPDRNMRIVSVRKGAGNWEHVRLQQIFGSLRVEGSVMLLHIGPGRVVEEVQGRYVPLAALDTTVQIPREEAMEIVIAKVGPRGALRKPTSSELVVYCIDTVNYLAWKVSVHADDPLGEFIYYVDAHTGKVLDSYDNLKHSLVRKTYNANHGMTGTLVRKEGDPATPDQVVNAAHDFAGKTYDFFLSSFQRDSWDGQGDTLRSLVHYKSGYNNAFWDGNSVTYGDGDGDLFAPLCLSLDVVAHELAHGVTQAEGDLLYRYQSGALNESFSDIFGVLLDSADWMLGEDVYTPAIAGDALRYMDYPTRGGQPDHMADYLVTSSDNGGVHTNSGIPNKAAFLMAQGGTHHGITVPAMGRFKMAHVFYASYDWLTPVASFNDARQASLEAARILYPPDTLSVDRAWRAVGVLPVEIALTPADSIQVGSGGKVATVEVEVFLNAAPLAGSSVVLRCINESVATIVPSSGTTDPGGRLTATIIGHDRGNTVLHVSAFAGSDSATGRVPVKVPAGSWPALVSLTFLVFLEGNDVRRRAR